MGLKDCGLAHHWIALFMLCGQRLGVSMPVERRIKHYGHGNLRDITLFFTTKKLGVSIPRVPKAEMSTLWSRRVWGFIVHPPLTQLGSFVLFTFQA